MALQKQTIHLPLHRGYDESTDERVRDAASNLRLINADWDAFGAVRKRYGFTEVSTLDDSGAAVPSCRALGSTGDELVLVTDTRLYAYNEEWPRWIDRGPVSPFCGHRTELGLGTMSIPQADVCSGDDGFTIHVLNVEYTTDTTASSAGVTAAVAAIVTDTDTGSVVAPFPVQLSITGTGASAPHGVRAAACNGRLLMFYQETLPTTAIASILKCYEWVTTSPSSAPPNNAASITGDLGYGQRYQRYFDAIRVGNNYCVAWISYANADIYLELRNNAHTVLQSSTITGTFSNGVALHYDSANSKIYVLSMNTGETSDIVVYSRSSADLTAVWGPTTMGSVGLGEALHSLGVTFGNSRVSCVWSMLASGDPIVTKNRSTDASGADLDTVHVIYNSTMITRPWYYGGRFYAALATRLVRAEYYAGGGSVYDVNGSFPKLDAWECNWVADLYVDEVNPAYTGATERIHEVAAIFDVGNAANFLQPSVRMGAANNATAAATTEYRFCAPTADGQLGGKRTKVRHGVYSCDFALRPLLVRCIPKTIVIGGGFVSWYDGQHCYELGQALAPLPDSVSFDGVNTSTGVLVEAQAYTFRMVWEFRDAQGIAHRSIPSPVAEFATTDATPNENTIRLAALSNPVTNRHVANYDREGRLRVYMAAADGIYYDGLLPTYLAGNLWSQDTSNTVDVDGTIQGDILYTEGGEIEAVCTEGARIPIVAGGRLLLGDHWTRSRFSYTKPLAPGTATEQQYAPEFNEAFGYVLPRSESITGMAALDDKTIIFTESHIYTNVGSGPADDGSANDFSGPVLVSGTYGCTNPHSVVEFDGGVVFQSAYGLMILDRGLNVAPIGLQIQDTVENYSDITSAVHFRERHQLRFTCRNSGATSGLIMVFDYLAKTWSRWEVLQTDYSTTTPVPFVAACVHDGVYYAATSWGDLMKEDTSTYLDDGANYVPLTIKTGWLRSGGPGGWQRVRRILPALRWGDHNDLTVNIYLDDNTAASATYSLTADTMALMAAPTKRMEMVLEPPVQKCNAISVEFIDATSASPATTSGAGYSASSISFEVGVKRGLNKGGSQRHP